VRADRVFSLIGSMHVLALAPPLSAILFAATSASAIAAWLGGMSLTRQTAALRGLGIAEARYLWLPAWLALALAYVVLAAVFTAGMVAGGVAYLRLRAPEAGDALALVTADLFDPPAERAVFRTRAVVLVLIYAVGDRQRRGRQGGAREDQRRVGDGGDGAQRDGLYAVGRGGRAGVSGGGVWRARRLSSLGARRARAGAAGVWNFGTGPAGTARAEPLRVGWRRRWRSADDGEGLRGRGRVQPGELASRLTARVDGVEVRRRSRGL
jgi:hypothetical protein